MPDWLRVALELGAGLLLGIVGWFVRETRDDLRQQRRDFEAHKVEVAKEYVTRSHLDGTLGDIKESLRRIEDRLNAGIDK